MDNSISRHCSQLYQSREFDLDRWSNLVTEKRLLKKEILKISQVSKLEWNDRRKKTKRIKDEKGRQ